MSTEWHAMETEELMRALKVSKKGLSEEEAKGRLQEFGPNELVERGGVSVFQIFFGQFKDIFVIMLLIAIAISILVQETVDAITISAIVVLNSVVGFVQEYRSEKAMEAMKKLTAPKARLMRDGKEIMVPAREVVPGDIVLLEAGDRIPADGRLLEVVDLKADEAILTGESTPVGKEIGVFDKDTPVADRRNMIFMATHVIYGRGKAVVTSTGMSTEFGKIAEMVQAVEEEETPLKKKLASFAKKLGILIVAICALIFVIELIREATTENIVKMFMIAISLAVSAVPEGLPAVVTISLALGARELAKRNSIIRKLSSAETLGATTIICSDKTGTLTKGEMTVREIYVNGQMVEVTGVGYEAKGDFLRDCARLNPGEDSNLALLLRIGTLCSNAHYDGQKILGDPTEGALIVAAAKAGMWKEEIEGKYPRMREIPFSSERKRMTTVHHMSDGQLFAYVKGAPEVILERCTRFLKDTKPVKLTGRERKKVLEINEKMASEALRVLGMAYKELPDNALEDFDEESAEKNLVFVGLMGMIDPPREEAKEANRLCDQAGIKAVMITGDHKLTAVAIAKELGMFKSDLVLTGAELDEMGDEEFEKVVEKVSVYARVSPEHKLRIVRALKKNGHIVAMTGDGVNDAPALKYADIGVAMGITGTDVSKEAADMVLADDNFATIVHAVEWGRVIYDNIRKFSFFLMRCNFDELAVVATFAIAGLPIPFTPGMILWINLVTDGAPAVALTMEPAEKDVMQRSPRDPKEGVLHGRLASIIVSFICQYLGTALIFFFVWGGVEANIPRARTMAFMQAGVRELLIVWNCRSEKHNAFKVGFLSNKFLLVADVVSILLTVSLSYIPVFEFMFETVPLTIYDWALVLPISCSAFLLIPEVLYGRKVWRWR